MMISRLKTALVAATAAAVMALAGASAHAASGYPINKPKNVDWSFAGPFGHWDIGQLQRGLKVYTEVCSACHALGLMSYRNLEDLGYTDTQIRNYAAEYEVEGGPDEFGDPVFRPAEPTDRFVGPYPNREAAISANNGAYPPDMSVLAKARAVERGFPTFVFDIFTMYAESGPDYIYSLLTGYQDPPEDVEVLDGLHYNPYFIAGSALAMGNPLFDEMVEYEDGSPETADQYAKDVSAFLMWTAEPTLDERKKRGFVVVLFLVLFAGLLYFTKKKVWAGVPH